MSHGEEDAHQGGGDGHPVGASSSPEQHFQSWRASGGEGQGGSLPLHHQQEPLPPHHLSAPADSQQFVQPLKHIADPFSHGPMSHADELFWQGQAESRGYLDGTQRSGGGDVWLLAQIAFHAAVQQRAVINAAAEPQGGHPPPSAGNPTSRSLSAHSRRGKRRQRDSNDDSTSSSSSSSSGSRSPSPASPRVPTASAVAAGSVRPRKQKPIPLTSPVHSWGDVSERLDWTPLNIAMKCTEYDMFMQARPRSYKLYNGWRKMSQQITQAKSRFGKDWKNSKAEQTRKKAEEEMEKNKGKTTGMKKGKKETQRAKRQREEAEELQEKAEKRREEAVEAAVPELWKALCRNRIRAEGPKPSSEEV